MAEEDEERWLPVVGWEDRYEISNFGRLRTWAVRGRPNSRLRKSRIRALCPTKNGGHPYLTLSRNGKSVSRTVHRIVLEAFVGPCPQGMECRHLDGDPTNNHVENLSWGTHAENMRDMHRHRDARPTELRFKNGATPLGAKLTEEDVRCIRAEPGFWGVNTMLATTFGVDKSTIRAVRLGLIWRHVAQ